MKTTVIHHSADMDGIFCREIARKFLPNAELIGWDFADKPLEPILEGQVYILDLPVDRPFGYDFTKLPLIWSSLNELKQRVVWIDHHASSIASHPHGIPGYRIDGVAACRLAWQWFKSMPEHATSNFAGRGVEETLPFKQAYLDRCVTEPLAVRLAGEYDIWDHRGDGDLEFQYGLRSRKLTYNDWAEMLSNSHEVTDKLVKDGKLLMDYSASVDASTMKKSFLISFEGLKFLALNTARCNSLTFASKDVPETGHDALLGFFFNGTKWTVSMYHAAHRKDLDLSTIAVKHGGGGHKGACGFTSDKFPFV